MALLLCRRSNKAGRLGTPGTRGDAWGRLGANVQKRACDNTASSPPRCLSLQMDMTPDELDAYSEFIQT